MKVKKPAEIAASRRNLESQLEELDDAEQAWAELTDEQRRTEMFHGYFCESTKHSTIYDRDAEYCAFDFENWSDIAHITKNKFQERMAGIIRAVPYEYVTDEQLVTLFSAIKKAVKS